MATIAEKIAKIIALAESTTAPEEADAFMAKAHKMLEEHGLSLLEVGSLDTSDPIGTTDEAGHFFAAETYLKQVGNQLARYYGCEAMFTQVAKNKFVFGIAGRQSAMVTFQLMYPFVCKQIRQLAKAGVDAGDFPTKSKAQTAIGNALTYRLAAMNRARKVHVQSAPNASTLNALVPVNEIKAVFEQHWPELKTTKAKKLKTNGRGVDYAGKVSLNHQTGNAGANKRIGS